MDSLTEQYCMVDDFYQAFEQSWKQRLLSTGERKRWCSTGISISEIMTLVVRDCQNFRVQGGLIFTRMVERIDPRRG